MVEGRPQIPASLERSLMIEAGHRCAIPTCRAVTPLQIDHIEDWAVVKEHKFENMIVLCANCHGLKGEGPRRLDRKALRQYKNNLSNINNRDGDLERRLLAILDDRERVNAEREGPSVDFSPGASRNLVTAGFSEEMSRYLRSHHALHAAPIDLRLYRKIIYRCFMAQGHQGVYLNEGGRYDVLGDNSRWLLKTESNAITGRVKIAKLSEGRWLRQILSPEDCVLAVRTHIAERLADFDRLLVLRREAGIDSFTYSLCEIPVDLIVQPLSKVEPSMFTQMRSNFRGYFEHPRDKVNLFEMFLDLITEKVGISFNMSYCINHGSWAVRRRPPFS